jgi:hypothetical protein
MTANQPTQTTEALVEEIVSSESKLAKSIIPEMGPTRVCNTSAWAASFSSEE